MPCIGRRSLNPLDHQGSRIVFFFFNGRLCLELVTLPWFEAQNFVFLLFIVNIERFLSVLQLVIVYVTYIFSSSQIWEILLHVSFRHKLTQLLNFPFDRSPKWSQPLQ